MVAASVHVATSGRRRARDFSSPVQSLDINIPSRISVNEPYLLVPAHVCFSMALITYHKNTPLVIYVQLGIAMRHCVSNPPNIPTTYPPGAHLPSPPQNPTRPSTLPTVRSICSICIPNHHRAPFVMYHQFLYSLYAIAEAEYLCTGAD